MPREPFPQQRSDEAQHLESVPRIPTLSSLPLLSSLDREWGAASSPSPCNGSAQHADDCLWPVAQSDAERKAAQPNALLAEAFVENLAAKGGKTLQKNHAHANT